MTASEQTIPSVSVHNDFGGDDPGSLPLYHQYSRQSAPQPAYLELATVERTLLADWNGEIGSAVPFSVWHGLDLRFPIPPETPAAGLHAILTDPELLGTAALICTLVVREWDGNNHVGRITDQDAYDEATDRLRELAYDIASEYV